MNKRFLLDIAKYVLAVGLLVWVVKSNWAPPAPAPVEGSNPSAQPTESRGLGYVWQRHVVESEPVATGYLLAGVSLYLFAVSMTLVRWYLLVRALEIPITLREAFRLGLMGAFFSAFLPGSVGGDLIKAAVLAHGEPRRRTAAFATVVMDRLLALWGLVWFVAVLGGVFWMTGMLEGKAEDAASFIVPTAIGIVAVSVVCWLVVGLLPDHRADRFAGRLRRLPLVGGAASEFWRAAWMYRRQQKCIAVVLVLTWIGQCGFVGAFYCGAHILWTEGMGEIPSLTQHYLLVPIGLVMQALVPTPGGAGGGEWSFGALYALFGASKANGVLASLVLRVFSWGVGLVGYVVFLCMKKAPALKAEAEPAPEPVPATSSC